MSKNYGQFSGNPKTEWLNDPNSPDRDMKLLEDFWYTDPNGRKWPAPMGSVVNGASIPRPLWSIVGSPYTDDYRDASVVHDVACRDSSVVRKDADRMFYYACLAGGCSEEQAQLLYVGVRLGDWGNRIKNWLPFSRRAMLFRGPGERTRQEKELVAKYAGIARKLKTRKKALAFAELEQVVDAELRETKAAPRVKKKAAGQRKSRRRT